MTAARPARGRFITFEGGEGAGKSTQVRRLAQWLEDRVGPVITTREPGGTPGAETIRALLVGGAVDRWRPMSELLLHYAARVEHVDRVVRPALEEGTWVVSDRFADSTMAYQGYGSALGPEVVRAVHASVLGGFEPDLTIVLDLPVDDGLARAAGRDGADSGRYEAMDRAFHQRVRDGFLAIAADAPERCVVVDSTRPQEEVAASVATAVGRLMADHGR